jgi:exosome complex exonuclease DIS3/RRP44
LKISNFFLSKTIFSQQNQSQQCGDVVFHSFDPVTVRLFLDSTNIQHEKLVFQLIKPFIEGFSVKSEVAGDPMETESTPPSKRKQNESAKKNPKKKKN